MRTGMPSPIASRTRTVSVTRARSSCCSTPEPYRKAHAQDWTTLEDIFAEAADYWRELRKPFWVFVH